MPNRITKNIFVIIATLVLILGIVIIVFSLLYSATQPFAFGATFASGSTLFLVVKGLLRLCGRQSRVRPGPRHGEEGSVNDAESTARTPSLDSPALIETAGIDKPKALSPLITKYYSTGNIRLQNAEESSIVGGEPPAMVQKCPSAMMFGKTSTHHKPLNIIALNDCLDTTALPKLEK